MKRALRNTGIPEVERKERNITSHSWRHYFNSRFRNQRIPDAIVQRMTEQYTHFQAEDFREAAELQEEMGNWK